MTGNEYQKLAARTINHIFRSGEHFKNIFVKNTTSIMKGG